MNRKKLRELLSLARTIIKTLKSSESVAEKTESEIAQQRIFNQLIGLIKMEFSHYKAAYLYSKSSGELSQADQTYEIVPMIDDHLESINQETVQSPISNSDLDKPGLDKPFKYVDRPDTHVASKPRKLIRDLSEVNGVIADSSPSFSLRLIKPAVTISLVLASLTGLYFIGSNPWPSHKDKSIDVLPVKHAQPGKNDISATISPKSATTESQLLKLAAHELENGNIKAAREHLRLVVTRNPTNKEAREQLKKLNKLTADLENVDQQQ